MFSEVSTKKKSFHTCFPSATDRQTDKQTDRARAFSSTRSSAQGNCSAKSLAGHVVDSSLSSLSSTSHVGRLQGGGGSTRGEGGPAGGSGGGGGGGWGGEGVGGGGGGLGRGRGQGTFYPPCHILHYHMVLRPKGTSHDCVQCLCPKKKTRCDSVQLLSRKKFFRWFRSVGSKDFLSCTIDHKLFQNSKSKLEQL